jgi:hypothetical protein
LCLISDEFFLLKLVNLKNFLNYNKFNERSSIFWNRELIIINLNPNLASPTIKHKNKNKNLNSNPVFKMRIIIIHKVINVISSKIRSMYLI